MGNSVCSAPQQSVGGLGSKMEHLDTGFSIGKLHPTPLLNFKNVATRTSHSRNHWLALWLQVTAATTKVLSP